MSTERATKRRRLSPTGEKEEARKTSKRKSTTNPPTTSRMSQTKPQPDRRPENEQTETTIEDLPAVKGLDSSDASTRRKTLTTVLSHLQNRSAQHPLSKSQCMQLWRGFYVAIYMHDSKNAISVQNLIRDVAGTFGTISSKDDELSKQDSDKGSQSQNQHPWLTLYHEAFWETITREWAGIDSHRMNKYLLLIRLVMRELFEICINPAEAEAKFELEATIAKTKSVLATLSTIGPLNSKDVKIPNGLRLHVLDVWVDELHNTLEKSEGVNNLTTERTRNTLVDFYLDPIIMIAASHSGAQKAVRLRAREVVVDFGDRISSAGEEVKL